jgi:hypothetical protein
LEGCNRKDILRCLREPTVDEEIAEGENEANDNERAAAAIWEATDELASASQDAVSRSGVMLRFEAPEVERKVAEDLESFKLFIGFAA